MSAERKLLHPDAALAIRQAITEALGNEVFFVGRRGPEYLVAEVQVLARGHESAVPAVMRAVRTGELALHNHPSGVLTPSEPDLAIAAQGGDMGIGFVIVDNDATRAYVVVEPHEERKRLPVEADEIAAFLGPGGKVEKKLPGYEHRPQQVTMATRVAEALNRDGVLLVEAGTGTGKSLAYLLPAILFALRNRERVVVSTNTINLQEQIVGKDLPFLRERLGLDFKSVLLKGRGNYLCLRKAAYARDNAAKLFDDNGRAVLKSLLDWSGKTADGSRSDLPFAVPEDIWDEVGSDGDDCMRMKSPYYHQCFFYESRRAAAAADIVVVNHHLLMADLATRAATGDYEGTAVLPPFTRVIIDEGHNLEDVASSYFGTAVTGLGLLKMLGRLQSEDGRRGVLPALAESLAGDAELDEMLGEALEMRADLAMEARGAFGDIARHTLGYLGLEEPGSEDLRVRLKPDVLAHPAFAEGVTSSCRELTKRLNAFVQCLATVSERVRRNAGEDGAVASSLLRVDAVRGRLDAAAEALGAFPTITEGQCRWIEVRKLRTGDIAARVAAAPLSVAELLTKHVHGKMKTVVLTSATLTVARRFDHFARRLGVEQVPRERVAQEQLDSPFDYARQALVVAPTDMPEPQEPRFAEALRGSVEEAVGISRGRAFVLFTSYRLLERTFASLEGRLRADQLNPLRQGSASRDQSLTRFRREAGSVLFAVDSFWEGVDVPGEALSLVILARLPFKVPTEPLQEARVEAIEAQGGDAFRDYAVPQAVIKFRQGFGRLIRTRADRGAVLVLDPRVTTKRYGRLFLESLPPARVVAAPRAVAMVEMRAFFDGMNRAAKR